MSPFPIIDPSLIKIWFLWSLGILHLVHLVFRCKTCGKKIIKGWDLKFKIQCICSIKILDFFSPLFSFPCCYYWISFFFLLSSHCRPPSPPPTSAAAFSVNHDIIIKWTIKLQECLIFSKPEIFYHLASCTHNS